MRSLLIIGCICLLTMTTGCSTIKVETDFDPDADFAALRTYQWIEHVKKTDSQMMKDPLIRKHVITAVENEMDALGYFKAVNEKPDFLIAFYTGAKNRVDVTHYHYRYGRWGRFHGRDISVRKYREGTLILDIIDARTKQLVWRGWAKSVLHGREDAAEDIKASVKKMLGRYPPK
ncbi:MAG: DUF4136 domain-containing protein [Candidatus Krumholzibacteriota bacterium]|nr:DUF4136 domain-containing protein [Candidatus Krumholzibacteriota bacterium]